MGIFHMKNQNVSSVIFFFAFIIFSTIWIVIALKLNNSTEEEIQMVNTYEKIIARKKCKWKQQKWKV